MKRVVLFLLASLMAASLPAQKYAIVDTEKILEALPEYTAAQEQISSMQEQYTEKLQKEYDLLEALFQKYQSDKGALTPEQRKIREQQIINREKEVKEMQEQYFGQEGTMTKVSEALFKPIQQKLQEAIRHVAEQNGYSLVLDVSAGMGILHYAPGIDISHLVKERLQHVR
ncbi:MAG: OmpH family outer membrane protein [Bacteroidales bacterium]|nr:OmpH family outer membrane protein [Bacteroidales bacterium]